MLTPAGQPLYRGIIRIHRTAAEAIHHIHLRLPEAALLIRLHHRDQAAPHTADRAVIQFLQEAPAVQCPQDHTAVAADPPPLHPIAAADQYQEAAAAGHTLLAAHHQEVLLQAVHHRAAAVAGAIRGRHHYITNI